jgi:hypothetical protein
MVHWVRSGSSILGWIRYRSGSRALMARNLKNLQLKQNFFIFLIKNCNLLTIIKDVQATGEAFSPQKENIQQFNTWNFLTFFHLVGHFCPTESVFRIRIRIFWPYKIRILYGSGSISVTLVGPNQWFTVDFCKNDRLFLDHSASVAVDEDCGSWGTGCSWWAEDGWPLAAYPASTAASTLS